MNPNAISKYQQVQIRTSTPGELLIALFDGLFRFLNVARHNMRNGKRVAANEPLSRAYAIVSELYTSLDHDKAPELCSNLGSVYDFCLSRITHANCKNSPEALDDVIRVLTPIREGFTIAVRQVSSGASPPAPAAAPQAAAAKPAPPSPTATRP
jgi:flagellar protein FliS